MGWLGTALTLWGSYFVGNKNKWGFMLQMFGNVCWGYVGYRRGCQVDLIVVSAAFASMYLFNFVKWARS